MQRTVFLFDWDGTLADSPALHEAAFKETLARHFPEKEAGFRYAAYLGQKTKAVFESLGLTDSALLSQMVQAKQESYRAKVAQGQLSLLAGARDLLSFIATRWGQPYLVTGGSAASVQAALDATGLTDRFRGRITGDDVQKGKPAPDGFLLCLKRYGIAPAQALVVEDARDGVEAAHQAGLPVIGIHNPDLNGIADQWYPDLPALHKALEIQGTP